MPHEPFVPQEAFVPQEPLVPHEPLLPQEPLVPHDALLPQTAELPPGPGRKTVLPQTSEVIQVGLLHHEAARFGTRVAICSVEL